MKNVLKKEKIKLIILYLKLSFFTLASMISLSLSAYAHDTFKDVSQISITFPWILLGMSLAGFFYVLIKKFEVLLVYGLLHSFIMIYLFTIYSSKFAIGRSSIIGINSSLLLFEGLLFLACFGIYATKLVRSESNSAILTNACFTFILFIAGIASIFFGVFGYWMI